MFQPCLLIGSTMENTFFKDIYDDVTKKVYPYS